MAFIFIFVFLLLHSHLFLTLADQLSEPLARSEKLNHSFLGGRSGMTAGVIAAIITLACIIIFNTNKQRASTEGFSRFPVEVLRCFSFGEIQKATGNFSPASMIRRRGFGVVYGGLIDEGKHKVVVKRLPFEHWNEVKAVVSKLWHGNLVSLIGYCNKSGNMFLVYEDGMPLGTLADNLNTSTSLSWEQRLRICIGVARGLDYLHTGTDHGVIHGDLKCSNILLYNNYKPKISDFRLTRIDAHKQLDQKLDVCSFGVVLLEFLCGKNQPQHISWARLSLIGDDDKMVEVDPFLEGQISAVCLTEFVAISKECLHDDPKKRPTMSQLAARLELLLERRTGETSSANKEPMVRDKVLQCYSIHKFKAATNEFSYYNILCSTSIYTIYGGAYISNSKASPWIIYRGNYAAGDISKLQEISHLRHSNLASMVGYCCSDGVTVVGYKDEGHGILFHKLSNTNQSWLNSSLPWATRLDICIGVAEALRCLHRAKIIHGCISPTTILLGNSNSAKLATFGRWDIAGSTKPTEETDVYLFGLLLYIVFCGKNTNYTHGYPILLPFVVEEAVDKRTLGHITDMNLSDIEQSCMDQFLQVAAACCMSLMPGHLLPMDAVVEGLKKARALQKRR